MHAGLVSERLDGVDTSNKHMKMQRELGLRVASLIMMAVARRMWSASTSLRSDRQRPAIKKNSVETRAVAVGPVVATSPSRHAAPIVVGGLVAAALVTGLVAVALRARRRSEPGDGGDTIVRCREGHLFTTIWVPGASVKAVRLGAKRFQHCPVGEHWTVVTPVNDADLNVEDRAEAAANRDVRVI